MIKIVGVRFRSAGKVYYFAPGDFNLDMGDHVIVETARGQEYGTVSGRIRDVADDMVTLPLREVVRRATEEDAEKVALYRQKEKEALGICRDKVHKHNLDMKLVDAEYSFDGSKILFYFTADGRIDFRDLVKDLASVFRMRIELRQIGVRDETKMLGGLGICGRELCCATYLSDFAPVSIKMAKEQNLSLNPTKISGTCGRLMCCLKNEEDTYEYLNSKMPKMGEEVTTLDGQTGKVIELSVLRQRVKVLFEEGEDKEIEDFPVEELRFAPRKRKGDKNEKQGKGSKARAEGGQPREGGDEILIDLESASVLNEEFILAEDSDASSGELQNPGSHDFEHKKKPRKRKKKMPEGDSSAFLSPEDEAYDYVKERPNFRENGEREERREKGRGQERRKEDREFRQERRKADGDRASRRKDREGRNVQEGREGRNAQEDRDGRNFQEGRETRNAQEGEMRRRRPRSYRPRRDAQTGKLVENNGKAAENSGKAAENSGQGTNNP